MVGFWDGVKFALKAIKYNYEQYQLKTNENVIVETSKGRLKGLKRFTIWGDEYFSFEKIPFAKPPLGELRFRAPVPAEPWQDVLDCTGPADIPMQANALFVKYRGSEDCLYLNVFTNNITPEKPRPVMVWIYGGGFTVGDASRASFSPDHFMSKDIVLVTVAYRLGPFGFLSLDDPSVNVPGNAGIKDQILSLKWVQENIAAFGGDPNNVTVFGESAGGASTHLCMMAEQSKSLMHKAVVMSGSALCPWARASNSDQWAYRLAKALGYTGENDDRKVFETLQNAKGPEIITTITAMMLNEPDTYLLLFPFVPVVEPYITDQCILSEDPQVVMKRTWSNQIPVMIGCTSFEGLLLYADVKRNPDLPNAAKLWLPKDNYLGKNTNRTEEYLAEMKRYYLGNEECSKQNMTKFLGMLSDREFNHPVFRTVLARQSNGTAPTYYYRFDFDSKYGNAIRNVFCGGDVGGVCHGDDVYYIWNGVIAYRAPKDSPEYRVTRTMIDIWTSFATNSDPNCDMIKEVKFEPLTRGGDMKCLNIGEKVEFIKLPELENMNFWNSLYAPEDL